MKKMLAKLLSINPLLGLALVFEYIVFLWYVTATICNNEHQLFAIVFALSITVAVKSLGLILSLFIASYLIGSIETRKIQLMRTRNKM
jgi:hypothetical protein